MPSQSLGKLEKEELLHIFREIDKSPKVTQRGLSASLGISLDSVDFLVNVLLRKGFVKAANFKKSNNKIAYLYCLTPRSIAGKSRMTYHFLKSGNGGQVLHVCHSRENGNLVFPGVCSCRVC